MSIALYGTHIHGGNFYSVRGDMHQAVSSYVVEQGGQEQGHLAEEPFSSTTAGPVRRSRASSRGHTSPYAVPLSDALPEEPLTANAIQEKIYKRRQARRVRQKRASNQQLEETVDQLARERDFWKKRASTLRDLLRSHGIISPDFED